jgi:hypothetical protein
MEPDGNRRQILRRDLRAGEPVVDDEDSPDEEDELQPEAPAARAQQPAGNRPAQQVAAGEGGGRRHD